MKGAYDPRFQTDFRSNPNASGFSISAGGQNPLLTGQLLNEASVTPAADADGPSFSVQLPTNVCGSATLRMGITVHRSIAE
jgi:hypothetical protein